MAVYNDREWEVDAAGRPVALTAAPAPHTEDHLLEQIRALTAERDALRAQIPAPPTPDAFPARALRYQHARVGLISTIE